MESDGGGAGLRLAWSREAGRLAFSRLSANASALVAAVIFGGATVATRAAVRQVPPFPVALSRLRAAVQSR